MSSRNVIAVVGATGAQGGGLVRAILDDPDGNFAARAITRDAARTRPRALADAGRRGGRRRSSTTRASLRRAFEGAARRLLRDVLLGALLAGEGAGPGRRMARRRRTPGVQHVIWSTLEDTRNWVPLTTTACPR